MDATYRVPLAPGAPLFPVSAERANQQKHPLQEISTSPSMPNLSALSHSRANSDVQSKVARFNSLNKDMLERKRDNEAAIRRALVGREEAESETRKAREDVRKLGRELDESTRREAKVAERLDRVMEDFHRAKDTHAHSQAVYEKEIRRARKEAFKSSSLVVKLQEDLKTARDSLKLLQFDLLQQRAKAEERERDAFAAKYKLVGAQEELAQIKESMRLLGEERDALKTSLKEEEVARVAAQGGIALPVSSEDDDLASPRKRSARMSTPLQDEMIRDRETISDLTDELRWTRRRMRVAEEQVEHMKIECQFRCCSCRLADQQGTCYEHDTSSQEVMAEKLKEMEEALATNDDARYEDANASDDILSDVAADMPDGDDKEPAPLPSPKTPSQERPGVAFCSDTGTFKLVSPFQDDADGTPAPPEEAQQPPMDFLSDQPMTPPQAGPRLVAVAEEASLISLLTAPHLMPPTQPDPPTDIQSPAPAPITVLLPQQPSPPHSPIHRTITTTTIVPLAGGGEGDLAPASIWSSHNNTIKPVNAVDDATAAAPAAPAAIHSQSPTPPDQARQFPFSPATMTREEAIEQIRLRRGRARSIAAGAFTPRKQMVEGAAAVTRRDISAPAGRTGNNSKTAMEMDADFVIV